MVPVTPFGIEKKTFKEGASFIGAEQPTKRYSYNILYRNECDPADNVHRFTLMPENPTFIVIDKALESAGMDVKDLEETDVLTMLPESMKKDIWGAWVNIDVSKRPLVRLYTDNVSKIEAGKVVPVHKAGEPMHKKGPKGEELAEYAVISTLPVWGFLKKNMEGTPFWLKGNDPMARIDREINQGRMAYLDTLVKPTADPKGLEAGEIESPKSPEPEPKPESAKRAPEVVEAPPLE